MIKKLFFAAACFSICLSTYAQSIPEPIQLVNGWKLSPVGKSFPLGDLPLNLAVSKSSTYMAVTNNGQGIQSIQLIDLKTEKIIDSVVIGKSWYGLKFSADEKYRLECPNSIV